MKLPPPFVREPAAGKRLLLFALCGALALRVGFATFNPHQLKGLIMDLGYYYMLGLFGLFVYFALRVARADRAAWTDALRRPGWPGLVIAAATAFALWSDPFQHKVLFDEYVLQATAYHMHITKEIGTVIRAYDIDGTWLPIDPFLDKRPYFFTFLLSLVHDLTGYRTANVFFLNSALTAAFFGAVYWFGRELTSRAGGMLAVVLLATMPLLGQNATCGGMEIHNLLMLVLVMSLALHYLRAPDDDRLALLCLGTVLLAESRYESVIYVVPVAGVVVAGWWRVQRVLLPWAALITPLLLIPYAWHDRYVSAAPQLWQLGEGQTVRFSTGYFAENVRSAFAFFFSLNNAFANSWYLTVLGCAGLVYFLVAAARWLVRRPALSPVQLVTTLFGAAIAGNFVLLLFYYWSRLTDTIAARFALPAYLLFALLAILLAQRLNGRWPAVRAACWGAAAYLLISGLPAMAHRFYTSQNLVMKEVD
jgi:4-amino-4-deoxy-L-arabinose transferase-like glycosyltransferase